MNKPIERIFGWIAASLLLVTALACIGCSAWVYWQDFQFAWAAQKAVGRVVSVTTTSGKSPSGRQTTGSCPVVEFKSLDDLTYTVYGACGDYISVGQAVEVLYPPNTLTKARVKDYEPSGETVGGFAIFGFIFLILGLIALPRRRSGPAPGPWFYTNR